MVFPEYAQQFVVADACRLEHHQHHLAVPGQTAADIAIGRIRGDTGGIPDRRDPDARRLPEFSFRTPETAHAEHRTFGIFRKRRRQRATADDMRLADGNRLRAIRQYTIRWRHHGLAGHFISPAAVTALPCDCTSQPGRPMKRRRSQGWDSG